MDKNKFVVIPPHKALYYWAKGDIRGEIGYRFSSLFSRFCLLDV